MGHTGAWVPVCCGFQPKRWFLKTSTTSPSTFSFKKFTIPSHFCCFADFNATGHSVPCQQGQAGSPWAAPPILALTSTAARLQRAHFASSAAAKSARQHLLQQHRFPRSNLWRTATFFAEASDPANFRFPAFVQLHLHPSLRHCPRLHCHILPSGTSPNFTPFNLKFYLTSPFSFKLWPWVAPP